MRRWKRKDKEKKDEMVTTIEEFLTRPPQPDPLETAQAERLKSEQRLEAIRRHVIRPLQEKGKHNQFADMIRATLEGGR